MQTHRLVLSLAFAGCSFGVIPRDVPPPPEPEPAAAEPTGPVVEYRLDGDRLELPGPIVFQAGGDALDPASDPALEHARGYLAAKPAITTLRIEGHADDQALSERRAVAVARWLVAHGTDCKRLLAVGFGSSKPIADVATPEGKAQNTRIELRNAALRGRPIGGSPLEGGGQVAGGELCQ